MPKPQSPYLLGYGSTGDLLDMERNGKDLFQTCSPKEVER